MAKFRLFNDDCLAVMPRLEENSVDLVLVDPPYGTTACKWDSVIDLAAMWKELLRIGNRETPFIFMASQPFSSLLVTSQIVNFKYSLVWNKKFAANYVHAKTQPLKTHEDIVVFSRGACTFVKNAGYMTFNPQKTERETPIKMGKNKTDNSEAIPLRNAKTEFDDKVYNDKCPTSIVEISCRDDRGKGRFHPTQKPVALMEYLIKTYSNEGDTVLDFAMGSGTTGIACGNLNRNFIGIDNDKEHGYFKIAYKRIREAYRG